MKRQIHLRVRKAHRYLGLFTGIQFIFWTLGGLYFSWSDIDEIHGDFQRKAPANFNVSMALASPAAVLNQLPQADSVKSIKLVEVLGKPTYQVLYYQDHHGHAMQHAQLAEASTAALRAPLTEQEAVQMALNSFSEKVEVQQVEYLTEGKIGKHHEYRASPLPAYAVTMQHPTNTTVYVATERGEVTKFRNNKWRLFDFFRMLHTMDYEGRDNFGNLLLRLFAVLGIVTVLSGFGLYFVSKGGKRGKAVAGTPRSRART
ncbi:PepSY-associated transmembrane protein [Pontibacter ummariensis]|uniref:PepSY-associated TM region n=1 Tax=Pontibacter ummariensis TaxID=1610492 RepID=A0A239K665_9BACT|nr:PepSY domain-containing protein [Pontibacter ummariensis]PRY06736.1 PepSY-associated transmembrane protein [Pontibacter ummariensis]SNT13615.1 PepSY-associated TM region [Pontibacter ummariensis]